jgi:hypothetical protein
MVKYQARTANLFALMKRFPSSSTFRDYSGDKPIVRSFEKLIECSAEDFPKPRIGAVYTTVVFDATCLI